jgi:hypothetical protein
MLAMRKVLLKSRKKVSKHHIYSQNLKIGLLGLVRFISHRRGYSREKSRFVGFESSFL